MANGYKQALDRFEEAVRACAYIGTLVCPAEKEEVEREYDEAKAELVKLLQRNGHKEE